MRPLSQRFLPVGRTYAARTHMDLIVCRVYSLACYVYACNFNPKPCCCCIFARLSQVHFMRMRKWTPNRLPHLSSLIQLLHTIHNFHWCVYTHVCMYIICMSMCVSASQYWRFKLISTLLKYFVCVSKPAGKLPHTTSWLAGM